MSDTYPFLILEKSCNEAIAWIIGQVSGVGLQVIRTFDWQVASHDPSHCSCPHHGTDQCDCQIVVLLIYGDNYKPVSLVAHSHDGRTWFSLVDSPQQRADPRLQRALRRALPDESILSMGQLFWSHAS